MIETELGSLLLGIGYRRLATCKFLRWLGSHATRYYSKIVKSKCGVIVWLNRKFSTNECDFVLMVYIRLSFFWPQIKIGWKIWRDKLINRPRVDDSSSVSSRDIFYSDIPREPVEITGSSRPLVETSRSAIETQMGERRKKRRKKETKKRKKSEGERERQTDRQTERVREKRRKRRRKGITEYVRIPQEASYLARVPAGCSGRRTVSGRPIR